MRSILVTGGFGFLGGHLIELLLSDSNNQVHVVDNLSTSPLPLEDLLREIDPAGRSTYSINDIDSFCRDDAEHNWDEIYHLASVVGPAGVLPHAGRIAASIVNDSVSIAGLAQRSGAKLVDVSTSEVYGGGQAGYCSESMSKIVPASSSARLEYAVGKLAAETSLLNLADTQNLDARIVRPFNVTGPRQSGRGGFVLPRFIGQALSGVDITVFGDGQQIRAFTHVKDMVNGIVHAMRNGVKGGVYNLGNPANRCSILELAEEVRAISQTKSKIVFVDPKSIYGRHYEEANNKFPDATKAISELGWQPRFGRHEAIGDTLGYMRGLPERLFRHLRGF
ncbi:MAG: NAD-dependent epimerase/dehydratase family protein [Chloroflexota bacterium]